MKYSVLDKEQKYLNNLQRYFSNRDTLYKIYIYLAFFTVFVVLLFGIIPLVKIIYKQTSVIGEMTQLNNDLQEKITSIASYKSQLSDIQGEIKLLDEYLPQTFEAQNYIVTFVTSAGEAMYTVNNFIPHEFTDEAAYFDTTLEGTGDVTTLLKNIEKINQVTEILRLNYVKGTINNYVKLGVRNFILNKQ